MTKSTITRERLEWLSQISCRDDIEDIGGDEIRELASMALVAMDSEPVAWGNGCDKTVPAALRYLAENERPFGGESRFNAAHLYQLAREIELMAEAPLYRHAQPAPASSVCSCPSGDGSLRWPCPVHPGNSPVIQDSSVIGWIRTDYQQDFQVNCTAPQFIMGANDPSDAWGVKYMPVAKAGGQQNAPQNIPEIIPDCWCRTCRPVVLNDMRFVVCPDCGNKRCPRANNHRNACTGSNEPGQEGSAYPDAPQSPGSEPATVPGKWIPVSEHLPKEKGVYQVWNGKYVDNVPFWFGSFQSLHSELITHWMPLPAAPQEVPDEK
nr:DUF551 domain-containing protein [Klebsiella variicola]